MFPTCQFAGGQQACFGVCCYDPGVVKKFIAFSARLLLVLGMGKFRSGIPPTSLASVRNATWWVSCVGDIKDAAIEAAAACHITCTRAAAAPAASAVAGPLLEFRRIIFCSTSG